MQDRRRPRSSLSNATPHHGGHRVGRRHRVDVRVCNRDFEAVDEAAGTTRLEACGASICAMSTVSKSVTPCRAFHRVTASSISV
ncbi:MAG TPA: hypothetical protein VFB74_16085, partial [Kribbellaceae bacterium]|nr:hypothetical protein [Kribbellaceae bacterium]